ncbi:MAG TPA: DUF979 domain-containing protein [Rhizomicrobium sp.]|jgi:uncharacterized membrane protein|nr:DUF979 domain-containing protein [Rhizomicrobium sp.]
MIGLDPIYILEGAMFAVFAFAQLRGRSWRSAAFWGCFAIIMAAGSWLPDFVSGVLVLLLAGLALIGLKPVPVTTTDDASRQTSARRLGNRLFIPALVIPAVTLAGTFFLPFATVSGVPLIDPKQVTLVSLAIGAIVGLVLAMRVVRAPISAAMAEGRRLVDSIGWAAVLPQALAALGGVFAAAGVGKVVAALTTSYIPMGAPTTAVAVYTTGMALFTIIMGNAFAAFPVMTAGIGLPLIVGKFGGDPVIVSAVGMLSGFCGTLLTPMAANFNIVPAAVLELKDRNAVIKVQAPTAFLLLAANTAIMALFAFHR